MGKIRIDISDLVGKKTNKIEVLSYNGNYYDDTKGGKRLRHAYSCLCHYGEQNKAKTIQRGQIFRELSNTRGGNS